MARLHAGASTGTGAIVVDDNDVHGKISPIRSDGGGARRRQRL